MINKPWLHDLYESFERFGMDGLEVSDVAYLFDKMERAADKIAELENHIRSDMCEPEYECRHCHKSRVKFGIKPAKQEARDG